MLNIFNNSSYSNSIQTRKKLLNISDITSIQKICFGFFADRYKGETSKSLARYEFNPGSLTAETLRKLLKDFLLSNPKLEKECLKIIESFLNASIKGAEQSYMIDFIRSNSWRLILFTKTHIQVWKDGISLKPNPSEIEDISNEALEQIKKLQPGESVSFLTGSIMHETIHHVTFKDNEWVLMICDSAGGPTTHIYYPKEEQILSKEFWNQIFGSKFSYKGDINYTNQKPEVDERLSKVISIRHQERNTCHFKCQFGILKAYFLLHTALPPEQALLEWQKFKYHFGKFLLRIDLKDSQLSKIGQITNLKHKKNIEKTEFFIQCINKNRFDETMSAYKKIFQSLSLKFEEENEKLPPLNQLLSIHKKLIDTLLYYPVNFEMLEPYISEIKNPYVRYTLETFKKISSEKSKEWKLHLEAKIASKDSILTSINNNSTIREIRRKYSSLFPYYGSRGEIQGVLTEEESERYLDILQQNPSIFYAMDIDRILLLGILYGKMGKVERLLQKEVHRRGLLPVSEFDLPIISRLLSPYAVKYVLKFNNTKLSRLLLHPVLQKLLLERKYEKFLNHSQNIPTNNTGIHYLNRFMLDLEIPIDRIESLLSKLKRENFTSPFYPQLIFMIASTLLKTNSHSLAQELLCKYNLPIKELFTYEKPIPLLSRQESIEWFNQLSQTSRNNNFLLNVLDNLLIYSLYHHSCFDELDKMSIPTEPLDFNENTFSNNLDFKTYPAALNLLKRTADNKFKTLIFNDLIKFILKENQTDQIPVLFNILDISYIDYLNEHKSSLETKKFKELIELIIKKGIHINNEIKWYNFFIAVFLSSYNSDSQKILHLTNTIIEKLPLSTTEQGIDLSYTFSRFFVAEYLKNNPQTPLTQLAMQNKLKYLVRDINDNKSFLEFMEQWNFWIKLPSSDLKQGVENLLSKTELPLVMKIWEHSIPSTALRDAFALFFLKRGRKDLALWIYPNAKEIESLS